MKPSWVLSDEERNRRFNKFNKINMKSLEKEKVTKFKAGSRLPELYMAFTLEEQKLLEDIHMKFQVCKKSWISHLLSTDRRAGINLIEAAYKISPFLTKTWKSVEKTWQQNFVKNVVPRFTAGTDFTTKDLAQIVSGKNSGISHFFKVSRCLKLDTIQKQEDIESGPCPMTQQVNQALANADMESNMDLAELMRKLNLVQDKVTATFPTFKEIYPDQEERHRLIMERIQAWPTDQKGNFDIHLCEMMTVILLFHADYNPLVNRKVMEEIQMKYILLMQRYLRSKMPMAAANKKFLEGMLLLSFLQELWEANNSKQETQQLA